MINLFPVMEHPTFVEYDFESKYSNKIPRLAQRAIVAAGFGFFYGKMFEVSRHQTAKVFAITELARNILRLLIIKGGDSSVEQQKLASGLFFVDTVCNAVLAGTMYKLNLIAVPGLLAFSVFYALYFTERFINVQQIASEDYEGVVTTERVVTMQGIPSPEGRVSLEQGQPSSLEPAQPPSSEQT